MKTRQDKIGAGLDLLAGDDSKGERTTVDREGWKAHKAAVERGEGPADFPAHFDAASRRFLAAGMDLDADHPTPESQQ